MDGVESHGTRGNCPRRQRSQDGVSGLYNEVREEKTQGALTGWSKKMCCPGSQISPSFLEQVQERELQKYKE